MKEEKSVKTIGNAIGLARRRRRLTQIELASMANVDRRSISKLERGEGGTSIGTVISILDALNLLNSVVTAIEKDEHGRLLEDIRLENVDRIRSTL